jgi:hypothetical protein
MVLERLAKVLVARLVDEAQVGPMDGTLGGRGSGDVSKQPPRLTKLDYYSLKITLLGQSGIEYESRMYALGEGAGAPRSVRLDRVGAWPSDNSGCLPAVVGRVARDHSSEPAGQPMKETPLSRDDALFWLNERIGLRVLVDIRVGAGVSVLSAIGELRHFSDNHPPTGDDAGVHLSEMFQAAYTIGGNDIDLSLPDLEFRVRDEPKSEMAKSPGVPELAIATAGVEITITPAAESVESGDAV